MNVSMEFARKFIQAYSIMCRSICQELGMPQTAFDILMFLANNPKYFTARDIVEIRGIKANLVSVNVDKLVCDGYLTREAVAGDRRKVKLACTEKAQPIIEEGHRLQAIFFEEIFQDVDEKSRQDFYRVTERIQKNLNRIVENEGAEGNGGK